MKKVKDSQKRWKQLVTMLLVAALLVTGTPDVVGFASEGTQEQVTAAAEQSQKTQEKHRKSQHRKKLHRKKLCKIMSRCRRRLADSRVHPVIQTQQ